MSPTEHTLAHLFTSLNDMDLNQMPSLNYLERTILTATDNKDMFREKFQPQTDDQSSPMSNHSRDMSTDSKRRTFINLTSGNRFQIPSASGPKDCHFFETKIVYTGRKIPIQIPITGTPDIVGDVFPKRTYLTLVFGDQTSKLFFGTPSFSTTAVSSSSSSNNIWTSHTSHYSPFKRVINGETNRLHRLWTPFRRSSSLCPRSMFYCKWRERHASRYN